jgi:hypothetical protein
MRPRRCYAPFLAFEALRLVVVIAALAAVVEVF